METAKVDIRKLQLLNDRINQCIDALNQVRLSVHGLSQGLSHTSGQGSQYGLGSQYGQGANPFTQSGGSPFGLGSQGIGQMPQSPWNQGFVPGLSHTGGQLGSQYGLGGQSIGANPFTQGVNPFTQGGVSPFGFGSQGIGQMPLGQSPFTQGLVPGLSHTGGQSPFGQQGINPYLSGVSPEALEASVRPIWADPILSARISQTFPYAQYPVPPVVTIY